MSARIESVFIRAYRSDGSLWEIEVPKVYQAELSMHVNGGGASIKLEVNTNNEWKLIQHKAEPGVEQKLSTTPIPPDPYGSYKPKGGK